MEIDETTVDQLQAGHESGTEWSMRRKFLLTHNIRFPMERLICLSNCYINVECYGCTYPAGVMSLLRQLSNELPKEPSQCGVGYHQRRQVKFVKSSETMQQTSPEEPQHQEQQHLVKSIFDTPPDVVTPNVSAKPKVLTFIKSSDDYQSTDVGKTFCEPSQVSHPGLSNIRGAVKKHFNSALQDFKISVQNEQNNERLQKFYILSSTVRELMEKRKNSIETIHMATDKARMLPSPIITSSSGGFKCELKIDFVTVSVGEASSKKNAKHLAYEKACDILRKPYLQISEQDSENMELQSSSEPFSTSSECLEVISPKSKMSFGNTGIMKLGQATQGNIHALAKARKRPNTSGVSGLSNFVIIEPQTKLDSVNAISILRQSADFNKVKYEQDFVETGSSIQCNLSLDSQVVVSVIGNSRLTLKSLTAQRALEKLKELCWTIQIKKPEDTDDSGITREGLLGELKSDIETGRIGDSNIGNQLLRKMGWTGGGLGKEGNEGIAEPIATGNVINREGLGLKAEQGISRNFLPKVKDMIQNYIRSDKQEDLVFSPLFKKEERALIHREAQKLGLKSHSHGTGEDRYLVLSRKRSAGELFTHVMRSGGETSKYSLVPPGTIK